MIRPVFIFFAIVLSFFYIQAYWVVRQRHNGAPELVTEVNLLKEKLSREQFRRVLQAEQAHAFRQEVARLLPDTMKKVKETEKDYPIRNLASVVSSAQNESLQSMIAGTLFETGKALFRQGEYAKANRLFKKIIQEHGYSSQVIEAHFLSVEGDFLLGQMDEATETINQMVSLFPASELTGFALIRLGQILEGRDRYDEALQVYRTVLKTFPYRNVASAAQKHLRHMEP